MMNDEFTRRVRKDGWTPARRVRFLAALVQAGSVSVATASCGLSREAAYRFRRRDAEFARQWDEALAEHVARQEREYQAVVAALVASAKTIGEARENSPWTPSTYQSRVNFTGRC